METNNVSSFIVLAGVNMDLDARHGMLLDVMPG